MLEHVAGTMAILLGAGTSRAEEAAYITLNRLGNALPSTVDGGRVREEAEGDTPSATAVGVTPRRD